MLLGSGDLRNALVTASKLSDAYKNLNIHLNDDLDIVVARNVLMAHILLSDEFDPDNPAEVDYLWDVWYSLQWTENIRNRFLKDVRQILSSFHQWAESGNRIKISDPQGVEIMMYTLKCWRDMASAALIQETAKSIIEKRYNFGSLTPLDCAY